MTNHPIPRVSRENILRRVDEILQGTDLVKEFEIRITGSLDRIIEVEYDIVEYVPTCEVADND